MAKTVVEHFTEADDWSTMRLMEPTMVRAEFKVVTLGTAVATAFGLAFLAGGQYIRIRLGEEFWVFGNMVSAMSIWMGLVFLVTPMFRALDRMKTEVRVVSDGVEEESGIFRRFRKRIEGSHIESVSTMESPGGGKRYGFVTITGSGRESLSVGPISNFIEFAESVRSVGNAAKPKLRANSESVGLSQELESLLRLHAAGQISDSEFLQAKKRVLKG